MSTRVILVDAVALVFAVIGFHMAFRQRLIRSWWARLRGAHPVAPTKAQGDDPVHYALIIFGMMLMAFGLILFSFTTVYAVLTS